MTGPPEAEWPAAVTLPDRPPEHTIGWDVIRWMERWLLSPMGTGAPLSLTGEQCRFLLWWYSVDADGRWLFRRGVLRRAKGWGKDPLAAMVALVEMLGPCRVGGWDADGPVGDAARAPLVAVAAVSQAQTANTTQMLEVIASEDLVRKHRLKLSVSGLTRARTVTGSAAELVPMTKSWRSKEGARVSAVLASETQHWRASDGGHELAAVISRNLAKIPGGTARLLSITNAHEPGEDSVAERDHEAWLQQTRRAAAGGDAPDILLDSREAVVDDTFNVRDPAAMVPALLAAYGDSTWIDPARLAAEAQDPEMTDAHTRRYLLNRITAGSRKWMDPAALDAAERTDGPPPAGSAVAVGFDGSRRRDATAVVAVTMESGLVWPVAVWERDWAVEDWEVHEREVEDCVTQLFGEYRVARFYADPAWWEQAVARWCGRWDQAAGWEMRGQHAVRSARAVAAFRSAVTAGEMTWTGRLGPTFRRHCLNAVERPLTGARSMDGRLHTVAKKSRASHDCIDVAVAAVLAWQARLDALADGWAPPARFRAHLRPVPDHTPG